MSVIKNREEFMAFIAKAQAEYALIDFKDNSLRDIHIQAADGSKFKIVWYTNLCTLQAPGFSLWFDDARIETTHPSFKVAMVLYRNGFAVAHIGQVYDHLVDGYLI